MNTNPHRSFSDSRFAHLLDVWNRHQDLRRDGASVAELAASRAELDAIRFTV
ncbi:MAG: hypothetical protein AAGE98_09575 [Actinomycetota bacterium]